MVVFEPRSNSMKIGAMRDKLSESLKEADQVFVYDADLNWNIKNALSSLNPKPIIHNNLKNLINEIVNFTTAGDIIVIMSNGGFGGIHKKILDKLSE